MSEISMYETLMELPLFKGASLEQISTLIEKYHLEFNTYDANSTIVASGSSCRTLKCILSGEVNIVHPVFAGKLLVNETAGRGRYIGFERLFGLDNKFKYSVRALTRCGTLDLSKSQYMQLLQSDQIYLFNALNYLSRSAQRNEDAIINADIISLISTLAFIIDVTTVKSSRNIYIESVGRSIIDVFGDISEKAADEINQLVERGIISLSSPNTMKILDRDGLLNIELV